MSPNQQNWNQNWNSPWRWVASLVLLCTLAAPAAAQVNISDLNTTPIWRGTAAMDSASTESISLTGVTWAELEVQGDEAYWTIWPNGSGAAVAEVSSASTIATNSVFKIYVDDNSGIYPYQAVEIRDGGDDSVKARGVVWAPAWSNYAVKGSDATADPPPQWFMFTAAYPPETAFADGDVVRPLHVVASASTGTLSGLPVGAAIVPGEKEQFLVPGWAQRGGVLVIVRGASTAVTATLSQRFGSQQ